MIQPQYYSVWKLFQQNLFRIPQYQRMYSWGTRQRRDLFADIRTAYNKQREHFLATVVCLRREPITIGTDRFELYDVVDGQQRLTTLVVLLRVISERFGAETTDTPKDKDDIDQLLVKPEQTQLLLQANHDNSKVFTNFVAHSVVPGEEDCVTEGDKRLRQAFVETRDFVSSWYDDGLSLTDLLAVVKNQLGVVFHSIDDEAAVYTVFEVLNSRGLDVDWLDKTKSMLMGIAYERYSNDVRPEKIKELQKIWADVYRRIAEKGVPGHEVMRFAATLKDPQISSRPLGASDAYDALGREAWKEVDGEAEVSKLILRVTEKLVRLHAEPRLAAVTAIAHARLLAVAIMLAENLGSKQVEALLSIWERVAFLVFGLHRKDARTGVGDYTRTAQRVFLQHFKTVREIENAIKSVIRNNGSSDLTVDTAIASLRTARDCYTNWEEELRYLLMRYEEYLCSREGEKISRDVWNKIWSETASRTIEHVLPQTHSAEWRGALGRGQAAHKHVHRLGNLVLLPPNLNSSISNEGFSEKRKVYRQQPLKHVREVAKAKEWTREAIDKRENELFEWIRKNWSDIG